MAKDQDHHRPSSIDSSIVTVHDVARVAGVSIATVSRVLNGTGNVGEDRQKRVLAAAAELGYTPNPVGQALRTRRTRVIGTMIPRLDDSLFSLIASGVQEALSSQGYVGFLQPVGFDNGQLYDHALKMIERGAEGLIVFGEITDERLLRHIEIRPLPVVSIYAYSATTQLPTIGFDNFQATSQLLELFRDYGHRHVALLSGSPKGNDRQASRIKAYQIHCSETDTLEIIKIIEPSDQIAASARAVSEVLDEHPDVTAFLCNRDEIAFSVLAECRRRGIGIPEHISVAGFDDLSHAALFNPGLTTVSVPAEEIARHAALALTAYLEAGEPMNSHAYSTRVVVRQSLGVARRG